MAKRFNLTDVDILIDGTVVGGAQELTVTITANQTVEHQAGSSKPDEILEGTELVEGTLTRAFVDIDLVKELLPFQQSSTAQEKPSFTLRGETKSHVSPAKKLTIFGAKINSWELSGLTMEGRADERYSFDALDYEFE